jgi:hypothetical protein
MRRCIVRIASGSRTGAEARARALLNAAACVLESSTAASPVAPAIARRAAAACDGAARLLMPAPNPSMKPAEASAAAESSAATETSSATESAVGAAALVAKARLRQARLLALAGDLDAALAALDALGDSAEQGGAAALREQLAERARRREEKIARAYARGMKG